MARLKDQVTKEIQPELKNKFGYKSIYMGPQIKKVVLNMGLGVDGNDTKILKSCLEDLSNITGQKPVLTKFTFQPSFFTSFIKVFLIICPLYP